MRKVFFLIAIVIAVVTGCTMAKHKKYIRDGIFISGLSQFAFLEEWGKPDRQGTWVEEGGQYRMVVGIPGGEIGGIRKSYNDVWIYESENKVLFFTNYRLVAHYDWS